ncbi:MAG: urea ABC transporter permease subunit UrtB [Devosia sp.]
MPRHLRAWGEGTAPPFAILVALGLCLLLALSGPVRAQDLPPVEKLLQDNAALIEKSSRRTISPAIDALAESGLAEAARVIEYWRDKELWLREADGRFFRAEQIDRRTYQLLDLLTGEPVATAGRRDVKNIKPNSGVRALLSAALVQFQLSDPDPDKRRESLTAIERDPSAEHLPALAKAAETETDATLKARIVRLERLLRITFAKDDAERVAAITSFTDDLSVEARASLNRLLQSRLTVFNGPPPEGTNIARLIEPGSEALSLDAAYGLIVAAGDAQAPVTTSERDAALVANISDGRVAGVPVASLDTDDARIAAYASLAADGIVPPFVTEADKRAALAPFVFADVYEEASPAVTDAARATLADINGKVAAFEGMDLTLDALSLASIYFLAAIGLAITFGVMGVINMAHGEFIMMGAYTGYVVQLFIPDYTLSILIALPLAFAVTFGAGVALERLVIRWLYHRPLETLLATFGISIALQQLAKNIFGTQARPLTAPEWLNGALVINDVLAISYIRIAIFVLALSFFVMLLIILNRTRLGLEVRAVTQNPRMAASMGIRIERINMLTFGLGSGIAGVAGVAIGLFAQVTSELGQNYIVQSFMTVVVGGVGNIWGTLAGATLIGFLQKGIEWFNPSNTLAAQTYMIIFIIIFIQFRPKGIFALKGRAAEA